MAAEMLVEINRSVYGPYLTEMSGKPVLYVELEKALYRTITAARLFWEMLSSKLQEWGFIINPYDSCIANKVIEEKQCTVARHLDDIRNSM